MSSSVFAKEAETVDWTHANAINRIVVSSEARLLATSDVDMNVTVREGESVVFSRNFGSILEKVKPTERIRGLAFSPESDAIYVAAGEAVQAIRIKDGECLWSYVAPRSFGFLIISPIALDVAEDGKVVAAFDNGRMVAWDSNGQKTGNWADNASPRILKCVRRGSEVVGTDSFSICFWNIAERRRVLKIGMPDRVYGMDVRRDGTGIATRTLHEIIIWDRASGRAATRFRVRPGMPTVTMHPTEDWIAYGEHDRVIVADYDGRIILTTAMDRKAAISLCFNSSGRELLIGCSGNRIVRVPLHP